MSYTLTMEPDLKQKAEAYAARQGATLDGIIRAYLVSVVQYETRGEQRARELHELIAAQPRLTGEPYKFSRQDAYDEEIC
jgi:hypothetical protein